MREGRLRDGEESKGERRGMEGDRSTNRSLTKDQGENKRIH